ncbi:general substrate transporter [Lojkania enalia]|uniref:General substrate transporter n=1 Tax=Lojkania enalia TaxID=147567 RepID=A0A9P4KH60_9PLEO|nr:general substrate transporter [Didymosphaeria enalia]
MSYAPLHSSAEPEPLNTTHHTRRESRSLDRLTSFTDGHERETRPPNNPYYFSGHALHTAISVAAGTVMCLFGYEQGVFGGIMVGPPFISYFNEPSPSVLGFVTSVYDLGCFGGAIISSFVGEELGRRWMLLVFTVIMTTGIVIQTVAQNMKWLVWGRLIAGIGNGGNTATAPVWHVECSKSEEKGRAVVKEMTVNVGGFVASNFITLVFSGSRSNAQWRFPLGIQLGFSAVILAMVWVLPESPRWLLMRKRDAEARNVLRALAESDSDAQDDFVKIKESVRVEQATKASWKQVFAGGQATRRVSLGVLLQMAQQLTGINVLCYYLPLVLHRSVGLSELTARIISTINAICFMTATYTSITIIERVGRRPLLMISAACMSLAFLGISISVGIGQSNPTSRLVPGIIATVFMFLYFTAFSFGWITVPWLYPAEVNSLSMRSKGAALATASDWLFNYVVVQTTPIGIHHLGWFLYLIYAGLNISFVPFVYYFIVETAGKSLEQIDRWFASNPGWRVDKTNQMVRQLDDGGRRSGDEEDQERMLKEFDLASSDEED